MLFFVQAGWDGSVEMRIEKFPAPRIESFVLAGEISLSNTSLERALLEFRPQMLANEVADVGFELQSRVQLKNLLFYDADLQRSLIAAVLLGVPPGTDEVLVDGAMSILRDLHDEPALALAAENRTFQVQVVLTNLLPEHPRRHQVLNALPGRRFDEGPVPTGVGPALKPDLALVVRVGQDLMKHGGVHGTRGPRGSRGSGESASRGFVRKFSDRHLSFCIAVKRPGDEFGALLIDDDTANLPPVRVDDGTVQVANRCTARRAAGLRLLTHSLDDFVCEVTRVELRNRTHDAVEQHPRGGLVDVFTHRHETNSCLL